MSDHVVSGGDQGETTHAPLEAKLRAAGALLLLVGALGIGFAAGIELCPRCPKN